MYTLTELETNFLETMIDDYICVLDGHSHNLNLFSDQLNMEKNQISGVVSSLVKKQIISVWHNPDEKAHNGTKGQMIEIEANALDFCCEL
jgi:hypothetical protein